MTEEPPLTWWGGLVMAGLLVVAIAASSIPMLVGVLVVAWLPWFGELRTSDPMMLLHFLWIYPALWFASVVSGGVVRAVCTTARSRRVGELVADLLLWLLVASCYRLLFTDELGPLVAALVSLLLMKPFVAWFERRTPPEDADTAD